MCYRDEYSHKDYVPLHVCGFFGSFIFYTLAFIGWKICPELTFNEHFTKGSLFAMAFVFGSGAFFITSLFATYNFLWFYLQNKEIQAEQAKKTPPQTISIPPQRSYSWIFYVIVCFILVLSNLEKISNLFR